MSCRLTTVRSHFVTSHYFISVLCKAMQESIFLWNTNSFNSLFFLFQFFSPDSKIESFPCTRTSCSGNCIVMVPTSLCSAFFFLCRTTMCLRRSFRLGGARGKLFPKLCRLSNNSLPPFLTNSNKKCELYVTQTERDF